MCIFNPNPIITILADSVWTAAPYFQLTQSASTDPEGAWTVAYCGHLKGRAERFKGLLLHDMGSHQFNNGNGTTPQVLGKHALG